MKRNFVRGIGEKLFIIVFVVSIVYAVFAAVVGLIAFKHLGGYPARMDFWYYVIHHRLDAPYQAPTKDVWEYIGGPMKGTLVIFGIVALLALVVNYFERPIRTLIFGFGTTAFWIISLIVIAKTNKYPKSNVTLGVSCLIIVVFYIIAFRRSSGGNMIKMEAIVSASILFGVPIILYIFQIGFLTALSYVASFVIVVGALFIFASSAGNSSNLSGGSSRSVDSRKNVEISRLRNKIAAEEHGRRMHNQGKIGYGHVDNKQSIRAQKEYQKKLEQLQRK